MTIKRKKASAYNSVNTAAICRYIRDYSGKIESMIQNETQLEMIDGSQTTTTYNYRIA